MGFSKFAFFHKAMLCGHLHHWLHVTSLGGPALLIQRSRAAFGRPPASFLKRRGAHRRTFLMIVMFLYVCKASK